MYFIKKYSLSLTILYIVLFFYFPESTILKFIGIILLFTFIISFFVLLSKVINRKEK